MLSKKAMFVLLSVSLVVGLLLLLFINSPRLVNQIFTEMPGDALILSLVPENVNEILLKEACVFPATYADRGVTSLWRVYVRLQQGQDTWVDYFSLAKVNGRWVRNLEYQCLD